MLKVLRRPNDGDIRAGVGVVGRIKRFPLEPAKIDRVKLKARRVPTEQELRHASRREIEIDIEKRQAGRDGDGEIPKGYIRGDGKSK